MKSAPRVTGGDEPLVVQRRTVPRVAKVVVTAFLAVLVPVYLHTYGPSNFLWFCDAALILTVAGMWLESSLLISMCSVGILLPQCLWLVAFLPAHWVLRKIFPTPRRVTVG